MVLIEKVVKGRKKQIWIRLIAFLVLAVIVIGVIIWAK